MGRGPLRAPGLPPPAWLLLLLLRLPWSVWGAEAFRGEWERPEAQAWSLSGDGEVEQTPNPLPSPGSAPPGQGIREGLGRSPWDLPRDSHLNLA